MLATAEAVERLATLARETRGLDLLLLFGSRAGGRTDARPTSDWDLGYLANDRFDPQAFVAHCAERLGTDRVDLVDLQRASGLLRYRAARDGQLIFEAHADLGDRFRLEAIGFWSEVSPAIDRAYEDVLSELDR